MFQRDQSVGQAAHPGVMGDNNQCVPLCVQPAKNIQDNFLVILVQVVTGGLIGQDQPGLVDQSAGDAHPLLLASRKLHRKMIQPFAQSNGL